VAQRHFVAATLEAGITGVEVGFRAAFLAAIRIHKNNSQSVIRHRNGRQTNWIGQKNYKRQSPNVAAGLAAFVHDGTQKPSSRESTLRKPRKVACECIFFVFSQKLSRFISNDIQLVSRSSPAVGALTAKKRVAQSRNRL